MNNMKKNILILIILLITNILCIAQTIGEWTTHTPGLNVISVDLMHNKVFSATPYNSVYYLLRFRHLFGNSRSNLRRCLCLQL